MPECRYLICGQQATHEVTVYYLGVHNRKAFYCEKHLLRVQEIVAPQPDVHLTNVHPIEKGTTMSENQIPLTASEEINQLRHQIASTQQRIAALEDETNNLEHVNADLKRDVRTADEAIGKLKAVQSRLEHDLEAMRSIQDALVKDLHEYIEDSGDDSLIESVNQILGEHNLPISRKHFHLVFTVPVQIRVEGDYPSKEAMRAAFEAEQITWEVSNYEETMEDDIEIVMIEEAPQ